MVQCSNCGTECGPDAKFCPNCGQSTLIAARTTTTKMYLPQPLQSNIQGVTCVECKQEITPADGPYVTVHGNNFHQKCFKCQICFNPITGAYGTKDGKRVCDKCGPQRRGFVVDPITGEKKEAKPRPIPNKAKK